MLRKTPLADSNRTYVPEMRRQRSHKCLILLCILMSPLGILDLQVNYLPQNEDEGHLLCMACIYLTVLFAMAEKWKPSSCLPNEEKGKKVLSVIQNN